MYLAENYLKKYFPNTYVYSKKKLQNKINLKKKFRMSINLIEHIQKKLKM